MRVESTGVDDPHLDTGLVVSDGSFTVNGVSIAVAASDSIDDVLARITASAAGVIGTFDAATEHLVLTQQTAGSMNGVVVANDTSGFVAATTLAGAVAVAGVDPVYVDPETAVDPSKPLNGTGADDLLLEAGFSVSYGSFGVK